MKSLLMLALIAAFGSHPVRAQSVARWHLELIHLIRPGEALPGAIGKVAQLAVLDDGSVYVAETSPARVALYDKTGAFARVVMREGSGPGEARSPEIGVHGDTLVAYDPTLGRLSYIAPTGKILKERALDIGYPGLLWTTTAGAVLIQANFPLPGWDGSALRVSPSGHTDTVRWVHPLTEDRSMIWQGPHWVVKGRTPFSPYGTAVFDPAGRLVVGGSRRSAWFVLAGGDTVERVALGDRNIPIGAAVRDSAWTSWRGRLPKLPQLDDVIRKELFPTTLPPWVTFNIDRRGEWWVGRPGPDGTIGGWDIIVNGRLQGHATLPARISETRVEGPVMAFGSDFVALLHEDESGAPTIGIYRIVRQ